MRKISLLRLLVILTAFSMFFSDVREVSAQYLRADYNPNEQWDVANNCLFAFWIPSENAVINAPSTEFKENVESWRDRVRRELVARNTSSEILQEFEREAPSDDFLVDQESFDDPRDDFANAVNGAIRSILSKEPEWLEAGRWENVDIDGATIIGGAAFSAFYTLYGGSERYLYKTAGVPITLEGLQRTKQWREKRLNQVSLRYLGNFLSLEGWTIENSRLVGWYYLKNANLLNTEMSGNFRDLLITQNAKEDRLDDITFTSSLVLPYNLPQDYFLSGQPCPFDYNRRVFTQPKNLSQKETIRELLEASLKGRPRLVRIRNTDKTRNYVGDVFLGVEADDLYATNAWQIGNLAQIRFFPESYNSYYFKGTGGDLRGWDLSRQDLTGSALRGLDLTNVNLTDSIVTDASFIDSIGLTVDQLRTTWNWSARRMDYVALPPELREEVDRALAAEASGKDE